jgi:hypothetical protein
MSALTLSPADPLPRGRVCGTDPLPRANDEATRQLRGCCYEEFLLNLENVTSEQEVIPDRRSFADRCVRPH